MDEALRLKLHKGLEGDDDDGDEDGSWRVSYIIYLNYACRRTRCEKLRR